MTLLRCGLARARSRWRLVNLLGRHHGAAAAGAAAMALLFQVSCMDLSREALESMQLANGDGYTYLALVESWQDTGQWSPYVAAHNAPEGLETHLTAPFPAGVLGLARLLEPWHGRQDAPQIAGKLSGPLLHVATAAVLAWGAAAVFGTGGALLAAAGFLVMPLAPHRFGVSELDHHSLHLFLAALLTAVLLRDTGGQARSGRTACLAGAVAGLGIWSGVEMLIPAGIGASVLLHTHLAMLLIPICSVVSDPVLRGRRGAFERFLATSFLPILPDPTA